MAGANHHTKAGYWESIREAQTTGLPIEFRGYVPEEDIPELFRTTSVLVMPYDSATGSSGPAHQACEYGVPIVGADIADFRDMAADEDMAISFYKIGDADNLAEQLITVLQSPELQRRMAERNFAAGLEMTIGSVVRNYLRWFELKQCKRAIRNASVFSRRRTVWLRSLFPPFSEVPPDWTFYSGLLAQGGNGRNNDHGSEPAGNNAHSLDFADPLAWRKSETSRKPETSKDHPAVDGYQPSPTLESDF